MIAVHSLSRICTETTGTTESSDYPCSIESHTARALFTHCTAHGIFLFFRDWLLLGGRAKYVIEQEIKTAALMHYHLHKFIIIKIRIIEKCHFWYIKCSWTKNEMARESVRERERAMALPCNFVIIRIEIIRILLQYWTSELSKAAEFIRINNIFSELMNISEWKWFYWCNVLCRSWTWFWWNGCEDANQSLVFLLFIIFSMSNWC